MPKGCLIPSLQHGLGKILMAKAAGDGWAAPLLELGLQGMLMATDTTVFSPLQGLTKIHLSALGAVAEPPAEEHLLMRMSWPTGSPWVWY